MDKTTDMLLEVLQSASPETVGEVLTGNRDKLMAAPRPFARYLRELLAKYGLTQNYLIDKAGFTQPYGYRLLAEERHTKQRDYILRFCFVAGFTLDEVQRLLKLYGMSPLYPRIPRDAVLIAAIGAGIKDIEQVDNMLTAQSLLPLRCSNE